VTTGRTASQGPRDWGEIRRRVDAAGAVAGPAGESPERIREMLEERARALARPPVTGPVGDILELLTFTLAREMYAIESRFVRAVFRLSELSLIPGASSPLFGITAWRGQLLTILDLRGPLGLSPGALNDLSRVIVLGMGRSLFGVLADTVEALSMLATSELHGLPTEGANRQTYVRGVTTDAVLVLDASQLFESLELPTT